MTVELDTKLNKKELVRFENLCKSLPTREQFKKLERDTKEKWF
jgi:hypothetical protein